MIWLIISIIASTLLFVLFSLFTKWKVDNLQAIVINYFTASILGFALGSSQKPPVWDHMVYSSWMPWSICLGCIFIGVFSLMALSAQKSGIGVTSIATKMSVIIPIVCGIFLYDENLKMAQWAGVALALPAILLTASVSTREKSGTLFLPLIIFICSGGIDTLVGYNQRHTVPPNEFAWFSSVIFMTAALAGTLIYLFTKRNRILWKNIGAGILLGIPNYFSIYFLLLGLDTTGMDTSTYFAVNNIGIVMLSTLLGFLLLKEAFHWKKVSGIVLAVVAILLISQ